MHDPDKRHRRNGGIGRVANLHPALFGRPAKLALADHDASVLHSPIAGDLEVGEVAAARILKNRVSLAYVEKELRHVFQHTPDLGAGRDIRSGRNE